MTRSRLWGLMFVEMRWDDRVQWWQPVRRKVDLDLSSRGLFKPNLTLLHHHFNLKIARFLCSSDFPNMGFNPKIPKLKGCCKVTTMETVVSGQLTAVLSRGATGLQSQSLDLPEFDDQSTFAATKIPQKYHRRQFSQIRCFYPNPAQLKNRVA